MDSAFTHNHLLSFKMTLPMLQTYLQNILWGMNTLQINPVPLPTTSRVVLCATSHAPRYKSRPLTLRHSVAGSFRVVRPFRNRQTV